MPSEVVPYRFLFRFSFAVRYEASLPGPGKRLLGLDSRHQLPALAEIDGSSKFAGIRMAWNERGLAVCCQVWGRTRMEPGRAPTCFDPGALHLWIDTRNTQNIHRASRFCHSFSLFTGNPARQAPPRVVQHPLARARELAPMAELAPVRLQVDWLTDGYLLEAWLPASVLNGYDPEASPKLGFYYVVHDEELGEQFLTVGREFPFEYDPSLWSTLELVR